jgi:acyl-CoA synthetase (AMP-forming)/AMP-acid ligase II
VSATAGATVLRAVEEIASAEDITVGASLARWAQECPDDPAHTFIDYLADRQGVRRRYTWAELDRWTRATAVLLAQMAGPGDRVAVLAPSGPEYVVGFLAALRAGMVAVPLFGPDLFGHAGRLEAALADCSPQVILTPADRHALVVDFLGERGLPVPAILCPDGLAGEGAASLAPSFREVPVDPDDVACLQYTSGSTRVPAGVRLTHRNLVSNARQIAAGHAIAGREVTAVSWLPLFHDMGLLLGVAASTVLGAHAVLMDPISFVMDPTRWLRVMGEFPRVFTAAPNFAYDFAARRVHLADGERLDLSDVAVLVNGAEPVQPGTLRRFTDTFGRHGLDPAAMSPSYGLAEATLMVTLTGAGRTPTVVGADVAALQAGRLVPAPGATGDAPGAVTELVSSGTPIGQHVAIVDPVGKHPRAPGEVGEIWVHGPNVGTGYHERPEESAGTFGARLAQAPDGVPAGPWLRTGDLGALLDGELFVTGRMKDLIIVDGRNIYPQDVEAAVQTAHPAVALNRVAVFSVDGVDGVDGTGGVGGTGGVDGTDGDGGTGGEAVVVVAEQYRGATDAGARLAEIERAVRQAVSLAHGVALHDVVLVLPDSIPRTSSGKIARRASRTAYLEGTLDRVDGRAR